MIPEGLVIETAGIYPGDSSADGYKVSWSDQEIPSGISEYRIAVKTDPNDISYERRMINQAAFIYQNNEQGRESNKVYLYREENRIAFTIHKKIDERSSEDQQFIFQIDYRGAENNAVTFYGRVLIPAGNDEGTTDYVNMPPGVYTITELLSNGSYQPQDPLNNRQVLSFLQVNKKQETAIFENYYVLNNWREGKSSVTNKMRFHN